MKKIFIIFKINIKKIFLISSLFLISSILFFPEHFLKLDKINKLVKNLGFSASFRTSDSFVYESTFAEAWEVPQYSVLDAQVNYKIESLKTIVKVGGNNIGIGSGDYRTRPGGPFVGKLWYMTLTFDEFLN